MNLPLDRLWRRPPSVANSFASLASRVDVAAPASFKYAARKPAAERRRVRGHFGEFLLNKLMTDSGRPNCSRDFACRRLSSSGGRAIRTPRADTGAKHVEVWSESRKPSPPRIMSSAGTLQPLNSSSPNRWRRDHLQCVRPPQNRACAR